MFDPRYSQRFNPQKRRSSRLSVFKKSAHLQNWYRFIAVGQGVLTRPFLEKLYIWGKRITLFPTKTTRFWVNLQLGKVLTKKPANLRMGKGKGGRVGSVAKVSSGSILLAISHIRAGLTAKIRRQIQVRSPFRVGLVRPHLQPIALRSKVWTKITGRYTRSRMYDIRYFLRKSNQSHLYAFVLFLFKWFKKTPRMVWPISVDSVVFNDEFWLSQEAMNTRVFTLKLSWEVACEDTA